MVRSNVRISKKKKLSLLLDRKGLEEQRDTITRGEQSIVETLIRYFELLETAQLSYKRALRDEKRRL